MAPYFTSPESPEKATTPYNQVAPTQSLISTHIADSNRLVCKFKLGYASVCTESFANVVTRANEVIKVADVNSGICFVLFASFRTVFTLC